MPAAAGAGSATAGLVATGRRRLEAAARRQLPGREHVQPATGTVAAPPAGTGIAGVAGADRFVKGAVDLRAAAQVAARSRGVGGIAAAAAMTAGPGCHGPGREAADEDDDDDGSLHDQMYRS